MDITQEQRAELERRYLRIRKRHLEKSNEVESTANPAIREPLALDREFYDGITEGFLLALETLGIEFDYDEMERRV